MPPVENSATVPGGRIARTYLELTDAIARRVVELNDQHLALDEKCALANGHTGKLLAAVPTKHYGPMSLDLHLQVLGLALMVIPDPARPPAIAATREFKPRDATAVLEQRLKTREGRELLRARQETTASRDWFDEAIV